MSGRFFTYSPRRHGKRQEAEEAAKQPGAILVRKDGIFRWDGKRWRRIQETQSVWPAN